MQSCICLLNSFSIKFNLCTVVKCMDTIMLEMHFVNLAGIKFKGNNSYVSSVQPTLTQPYHWLLEEICFKLCIMINLHWALHQFQTTLAHFQSQRPRWPWRNHHKSYIFQFWMRVNWAFGLELQALISWCHVFELASKDGPSRNAVVLVLCPMEGGRSWQVLLV